MRSEILVSIVLLCAATVASCSEEPTTGAAGTASAGMSGAGMSGAGMSGGTSGVMDASISSDASTDALVAGQGGSSGSDAATDAGLACVGGEIQCGQTCVGPRQTAAEGCTYLGKVGAVASLAQDDTALYLGGGPPLHPVRRVVPPATALEELAFATILPAEMLDIALSTDALYASLLVRPHYRIDAAPKAGGDVTTIVPELRGVQDIQIDGSELFVSATIDDVEGLFAFDLQGQGQQLLIEDAVGDFRVDGDRILYAGSSSVGDEIKSIPRAGGTATEVMAGQYTSIDAVLGDTVFAYDWPRLQRSTAGGGMPTTWMGVASAPDPAIPESIADLASLTASTQVGEQMLLLMETREDKEYVVLRGNLSDPVIVPERLVTFKVGETASPAFIAQHGNKLYVALAYYSVSDWFVVAIDLP
jgi:hypothetical protein